MSSGIFKVWNIGKRDTRIYPVYDMEEMLSEAGGATALVPSIHQSV
jgi:hypothetical protein